LDKESFKLCIERLYTPTTKFYYQLRWFQHELNIQWDSSIINWMNTIDKVLDTIDIIPELSNLIKSYI
jgi:hypothetical protein